MSAVPVHDRPAPSGPPPHAAHAALAALLRLIELAEHDERITVHAVVARSTQPPGAPGPAELVVDRAHRTVHDTGGHEFELSRREFDLLVYLAGRPPRVFTREHLLDHVWRDRNPGPRTVDVCVRRLRMKLGRVGQLITTVRCVGYRFDGQHLIALSTIGWR
jgi:DNA-binding response OmpR family regulator